MADGNSKRIKLEPTPEVSEPDTAVTTPVTAEPSIYRMPHGDLIKKLQEVQKRNRFLSTQNADFIQDMNSVGTQNYELMNERESLLQQLQEEMSKSEALRQTLTEQEMSQQSIVDSVTEQHGIRMQEMSRQIEELTNQWRVFIDQKRDLTEQLNRINEENTCAICLAPWEAQGNHRIVSLACGHLFGKNCIRVHLAYAADCPLCKQPVHNGDARYIYGCRIMPARSQPAQPSRAVRGAPAAQPEQQAPQPAPRQQQPAPPVRAPAARPARRSEQLAPAAQRDPRPEQQAPAAQPTRRPEQQATAAQPARGPQPQAPAAQPARRPEPQAPAAQPARRPIQQARRFTPMAPRSTRSSRRNVPPVTRSVHTARAEQLIQRMWVESEMPAEQPAPRRLQQAWAAHPAPPVQLALRPVQQAPAAQPDPRPEQQPPAAHLPRRPAQPAPDSQHTEQETSRIQAFIEQEGSFINICINLT